LFVVNSTFRRKMESIGLEETILRQHGCGPPTTIRGSTKIDGLFVSQGLQGMRCGYTDFISDHRGLFVDLPMHVALGHAIPPILRPTMRRLKLIDPRVVRNFNRDYMVKLSLMNVPERLQILWENAESLYNPTATINPLTTEEQAEYELIDCVSTEAMLAAERTCRKLYMGAVPWSPVFLQLQQRHSLLQAQLRKLRGHQICTCTLHQMARRIDQEEILQWSKSKLKRALESSRVTLREFKSESAITSRSTYLEQLAESIAKSSGMEAAKVIQ
jgi:hypothetical protein